MPLQLGFVSAILPDLSFREVFELASAEGYECVEVMCWPPGKAERRYAGVTHLDVTKFSKADAARANELFDASGVALSGLGYYPNALARSMARGRRAADRPAGAIRRNATSRAGPFPPAVACCSTHRRNSRACSAPLPGRFDSLPGL